MLHTYKIATLNINGIAIYTKMIMLGDFLKRQETDIALLHEVTHNDFTNIHEHNAIVNEGTDKRGLAILVKTGLKIQDIKRI
jgi:exonuclease III